MMTPGLKTAEAWATILACAGGFLSGLFYVGRWIVLWMWRVDHMMSNHIVHIEHYLKKICEKLGIEYTEPEG